MAVIYGFTILASGAGYDSDALADFSNQLYETGGDDASVSLSDGMLLIEFHREAESPERAIYSAVFAVQASGAEVLHIIPGFIEDFSELPSYIEKSQATVAQMVAA